MAEFSGGRGPENKPSLTHSFAPLRSVALAGDDSRQRPRLTCVSAPPINYNVHSGAAKLTQEPTSGQGLPDFHGLLGRDGQRTACLYAFDLLHLRATDLPPGITSGLTRSAEQSANVALCLEFANRGH
jgi:hypothetical protein